MAQVGDTASKFQSIEPFRISISYDKTSNIIFPYPIKSVDRGSSSVLVQKANGVENILQLKASQRSFQESNVTVVTSDGNFFSFLVDYAENPSPLNLTVLKGSGAGQSNVQLSGQNISERTLDSMAKTISQQKRFLHKHSGDQKLFMSIHSIYLLPQTMWVTLEFWNTAQIDFRAEQIRFFLRDRKRAKRTAIQENELQPVYLPDLELVRGLTSKKMIVAFKPFTIPKTKELVIEAIDQNGGRSITLRVPWRVVLKTRMPETIDTK